ncbi:MAG: type II secretion system protein J [Phycisphaerales bacterium JB059]
MRSARGFTLIETILAAALGSVVLLGTVSVFHFAARSEGVLAKRFEQTNEMARLQLTLRRAMQTLVMKANSTVEVDEDAPVERARVILGVDEVVMGMIEGGRTQPRGAASVQRLEVVLSAPPLPNSLLGPAAGWASPGTTDALDFSLADLEGENTGGVRGVFELRPDGQRERLMRRAGLDRTTWEVPDPGDERAGWTLWWRPMTVEEIDHLNAGGAWLQDDIMTEAGQMRLAGAAPLVRGLTDCRWQVFNDREMHESYEGLEMRDLPAYVTLELRTASGLYANWMLEMGWTIGADPYAEEEEETDGDVGGEAQAEGLIGGNGATGGVGGGRGGTARDVRGARGGSRRGARTNEPAPRPEGGRGGREFTNTRTVWGNRP